MVEIITDFEEKKKGLGIIMSHNGAKAFSFEDKQVDSVVILKLKITSISGKQSGNWDKIFSRLYDLETERTNSERNSP